MSWTALPRSEMEFLELAGARRGCLRSGGHVDLEKISSILVSEFRGGKLGRITLETPDMIVAEEIIVAREQERKAAREALRKGRKRGSRDQEKPTDR